MNCEQVEELLSAYLDGTLALGETAETASQLSLEIEVHLQECFHCSTALADFRRFDALLTQMPLISPNPSLRDRIFSSPEYLELTGTFDINPDRTDKVQIVLHKNVLHKNVLRDTPGRPQLVALPGGRRFSSSASTQLSVPVPQRSEVSSFAYKHQPAWGLRVMQIAIAASIVLTLGISSFIGWHLWLQKNMPLIGSTMIMPPAGLTQHPPLSAGIRFVFLRDSMLWSMLADGSRPADQLTPRGITVAANWAVSPPLPGRSAGDMLAYIDLQRALIHTLRSDGQRDTIVRQPLLKAGVAPVSVWDTVTGETILNSLSWSKDGTMLAFAADPKGTGSTSLYILSPATGTIQPVSLQMSGSVSHPTWSPDGIRIAFELTYKGMTSILDYNTQNHGVLDITNSVASQAHPNDTLLTLDWSPDIDSPAVTWSTGVSGHVHSIWLHHVGFGGTSALVYGDYAQAIFSRYGHEGVGSWLLTTSFAGHAANLWRLDATAGALPVALTNGKEVTFAQWSPDGTQVDYLDRIASNVGILHVINVTTRVDTFIAKGVTNEPFPAWSEDGRRLAYGTGTSTVVVNMQGNKKLQPLKLHGLASSLVWSASSPQQLIVTLSDGQEGVYLVDMQHNAVQQVDQEDINGPILWTEIP